LVWCPWNSASPRSGQRIMTALCNRSLPLNIPPICLMRASAVEANRAHNPEVVGSNPTPATKTKLKGSDNASLRFLGQQPISFTTGQRRKLRITPPCGCLAHANVSEKFPMKFGRLWQIGNIVVIGLEHITNMI